jgi:hypothetical protein
MMTDVSAFIVAGTATQPQRFVIGAGKTVDRAQVSGKWLASDTPVEVTR